jgi:type III secretion protein C
MSSWHTVGRLLRAAVVSASLLVAGAAQGAVPASWKDTGFSIDSSGMTLSSVFEEFGRVYGVRVSVGLERDAMVKGRLKADNGIEFLDRLAQPHRFRWFVYNDTLYIVPRDDNASVRLQVGEDAVQDAKQALIGIGLFDPRFGWGELPDEGIVIVSGPREYVNLARSILLPDEKKVALQGRQVMLFRLKYASATDRLITSRGRSETVPGIKTILSNLLFGHGTAEKLTDAPARLETGSRKRSRNAKVEKGGAREVGGGLFGLASKRAQDGGDDEEAADRQGKSGYGDTRPRIEADPSQNAIMIYDNASKRAMYAALIEELDVEPQQVEIEALIVDIDRSKLSEMGVEWGVRSRNGNVSTVVNAGASDSSGLNLPLSGSTLLISNAARFYARLKAMEGNGEARVLATPTVLTLDNVAAVLDLSQTRYLPLLAERFADLADVTAGTMLRVIPRIVRDGTATRVRLEVDIEDGALGDNTATSTSVTRSTISTQAIVDVQQTLVIGGYHADSLSSNKQKVPVLGDVPFVGGLFRNETQSYGSRERLFLITPRLVGSTSGTVAADQSRVVQRRASTIARASGALDSGRPVEVRDGYATPVKGADERSALPAPAAPPRADVSRADPAVAATPAAVIAPRAPMPPAAPLESKIAAEPPKQSAAPAPAMATPLRQVPALATANGASAPAPAVTPPAAQPSAWSNPSQRFDSQTYGAALRLASPRSSYVQAGTVAAAPVAARPAAPPASAPNAARTTAASLDGVVERLDHPGATREPVRQPVAVARPVSVPDPAYAALLVAESRRVQAMQAQQKGISSTASSGRISGASDLSLANRRRMEDWR